MDKSEPMRRPDFVRKLQPSQVSLPLIADQNCLHQARRPTNSVRLFFYYSLFTFASLSFFFIILSRDDVTFGSFLPKAIYIRLAKLLVGTHSIEHYFLQKYTKMSRVYLGVQR